MRFLAWCFSQEVRALHARIARRDEEIACLTRQRDAVLDMLESLQHVARLKTAAAMAQIAQLGVTTDGSSGVDNLRGSL